MKLLLHVLRSLGLFKLSRWLTRNQLRILCYHGISLHDEHEFNAGVFMRSDTFSRRMQLVKKLGLPVMGLEEAVQKLSKGQLPALTTVITIDDGWYGTYVHMHPVLRELELPATLYVATAFVESNLQVYNVATGYVLWRNRDKVLSARSVREGALSKDFDLSIVAQRREAERELIRFGFGFPSFLERQALWREVCEAVDEDWEEIEKDRRLAFVNKEELHQMMEEGLDIQLHTHGHRFPSDDREDAMNEVVSNREYLNALVPGEYRHFCYPSGQYEIEQIDDLRDLNVISATTTKGGLNRQGTSVYELRRLIDSDKTSDLEFEARISGVLDLLQRAKGAMRRLTRSGK